MMFLYQGHYKEGSTVKNVHVEMKNRKPKLLKLLAVQGIATGFLFSFFVLNSCILPT